MITKRHVLTTAMLVNSARILNLNIYHMILNNKIKLIRCNEHVLNTFNKSKLS
jgi:hypothetical protein